jgi:hypothetical protein
MPTDVQESLLEARQFNCHVYSIKVIHKNSGKADTNEEPFMY